MGAERDPRPSGPTPPAYESASLVSTLHDERERMRDVVDWLGARSGELRVANRAQAVSRYLSLLGLRAP